MGRGREGSGVELREKSIRILFSHQGQQCKETLYLDNAPLPPTPPNVKYAKRIAAEIKERIRAGTFVYGEYFPNSKKASATTETPMLHKTMDEWLKLLERKASTKSQYSKRITSFWKVHLKDCPISEVKHSDILRALQAGTWTSGKSRNNELSMIKGFFEYARKDKLIADNPCAGVDRAKHQKKKPDPFSMSEVKLILASIKEHCDEQIHNYTQFVFFTGLRTSEAIALKWENVDFRKREILVEQATVYDEEGDTKTSTSRTVKLTNLAYEALERQKAKTFLAGGNVFKDPRTGEPWAYAKITDVRGYWGATLKRLGIRYRRPYCMRHTYAALGLMSGARPAFLANQLGHSLQMFFEVYADWINSSDDDKEMAKIEAAIVEIIPELTQKSREAEGKAA